MIKKQFLQKVYTYKKYSGILFIIFIVGELHDEGFGRQRFP
jgi:hypothetical protein